MISPIQHRRAPADALMLFGLAVLIVPACIDVGQAFWSVGRNSQSPIVLAAVAFLYVQARDAFDWQSSARQTKIGAAIVGLALLASIVGHALHLLQLEGLAIALAGPGVCLLWGKDAARRLWRPNALLLFMIPLPGTFVDSLLVPLKRGLCEIVVSLLASAGYPIALSGVVISIDFNQIQVADACSGLWSMISLVVVGLLYEMLMPLSSRRASFLFLLMIAPVALLTNFLRVLTLVLVVHHFGAVAEARVHDVAAATELLLSLILFVLARRLIEALFGQRKPIPKIA